METCRVCGCRCDPGDTINGVCDDCRMENEERAARIDYLAMMLNRPGKQMELNLEVMDRGRNDSNNTFRAV